MSTLRSWVRDQVGGRAGLRRLATLVWTCVACALLLTDFAEDPVPDWAVGEVAGHDVVAPDAFPFVDAAATLAREAEAEAAVAPVFEADLTMGKRVGNRVSQAFDMARRRLPTSAGADAQAQLTADFLTAIEVSVDPADLAVLQDAGYSRELEDTTLELIEVALRRHVIADRSTLPSPARPVTVVRVLGDDRDEQVLDDFSEIRTVEEARQAVSLHVVERFQSSRHPEQVRAAAAVARAAVRPNFAPAPAITEARRTAARAAVGTVQVQVQKGTRLVAAGDVVTPQQRALLDALSASRAAPGGRFLFGTWLAFTAVLVVSAVAFSRGTIRKFAWRPGELEAMGLVLVLVLGIGRLVAGADLVFGTDEHLGLALALLAPVGGGAMVVRILTNSESALVWSLVASLLVAARQDTSALLATYYVVVSLAAASGAGQARERLAVLRSGLQSGLVGAGMVILLVLVRAEADPSQGGLPDFHGVATLWGAALVSGVIGACFTLGVIPAFELVGFTTDYKLLELANLNHPLLRQLMLRAPGTYHHSVIVGSLSEAACEAIGANALLARVACYFHDIGKGLKPQYFVENQRETPNKHDRLSPTQSAQVIINHVRDGAALAVQYKLPRAVADHIFMHHGTGIIHYFHEKAKEQAAPGETVDEALFRYPGPKPDSREAGVIMLADKVEAACRTIREPSEARLRAMIQQIVNSVMSDGQLENCPLTLRELYQIADAFTTVLLGIYHHRIEYPATAGISAGRGSYIPVPRQGTITLEIVNPITRPATPAAPATPPVDYESADQLPRPPTLPPYDDS